jgi:hypothetical protein
MSAKTRDVRTVVTHAQLEKRLEEERALQAKASQELVEKSLAQFYEYLLQAGHLRPTPEADAEVRRRLDAREISLPKPTLITP